MAIQHPYYEWVPTWLRDAGVINLLILQNFVFGLSTDMLPELTGELGTLAGNIKFIIEANAIGFICTLPLYYRFRSFFQEKRFAVRGFIHTVSVSTAGGLGRVCPVALSA